MNVTERARVLVFQSLDRAAIEKLLVRAETIEGRALPLDAEVARLAGAHGLATSLALSKFS